MPHIYLCFLWHMHQPFYKDLISGEYKLPWTRLHALKDYYGMVKILEEFPKVRQTFNLVPSMMVQVQEYAAGHARDPFLQCALRPAEELSTAEQDFLLQHSFNAYPPRLIYRYPRYGDLYDAWQAQKNLGSGRSGFGIQEFRDLQVLSQLAWFDEEFLTNDHVVTALVGKGKRFTVSDQAQMGQKQREILGLVIPTYKRVAARGQIEISTTPYYHPILPLVCDSNIAGVSHPNVPLPSRYRYPQDAHKQLEMARDYIAREFGVAPVGLWPSEGSVSDEVFGIGVARGFQWTATDNGVLSRTLGAIVGADAMYRPYRWSQNGKEISVIFRDHFLSDLIGFVYSRMGAREAAEDFLYRIRENCRGILMDGRDALVPIILDGENAWEYYDHNGRAFLRELYGRISDDTQMTATTVCDALARIEPQPLGHIFPGSWINANFDVWIGAEEDNQAWEYLLRARETYESAKDMPMEQKRLAFEELLIAEGSDWCWWYGPEHDSANRVEFDQLYRGHLANVYRFLGQTPPEELSRSILRAPVREFHLDPTGSIHPVIDGEVTSYFEWIGAGVYRVDQRSGSMHGKRFLVKEVFYGSDGIDLFLRIDFNPGQEESLSGMELRLSLQVGKPGRDLLTVPLDRCRGGRQRFEGDQTVADCAFQRVLELRIALGKPDAQRDPLRFQFSLWKGGLPLDAVPQQGWLEMSTGIPMDWMA